MNDSNYSFTLNLHRTQSQIAIPVTRGDTARIWHISLSDGGKPYAIADGCLAKLEIKRPTGTYIEAFCAIENNASIRYDFAQNVNTASVEGLHECAVVLFDEDGNILGSPRFTMTVSDRVVDSDDINLSDEDQLVIESMIAAEAGRQNAEHARMNTESVRMAAEDERIQSENARRTADTERALAEESRRRSFEALVGSVNAAAAALVSPAVRVTAFDGGQRVTVTDHRGEHTFTIMHGAVGPQGAQGPQGIRGLQGVQGETGKPFSIARTYASVTEMNEAFPTDGVAEGCFVVISDENDADSEDNAKLFVKGKGAYTFVTDLSGARGIQGPQGFQGPQGVQGPQGAAGRSAYDFACEGGYLGTQESFARDINPDALKTALSSYIAEELARREQLSPGFFDYASELETSGDRSKLYVLSDGYIYAFIGKKIPPYVNLIPFATDTDGSVYNGVGYAENTYLSSSTSMPGSKTDFECTGFIPIGVGSSEDAVGEQVVYLSGIGAKTDGNFRFILYGADQKNLTNTTFTGQNLTSGYMDLTIPHTLDENGNVTSLDLTALTAYLKRKTGADAAFLRISCPEITGASVLTVNQPIVSGEDSVVYAWTNTGLRFVPADYEPRIVSTENAARDNAEQISMVAKRVALMNAEVFEMRSTATPVPAAVREAASALADKAASRENGRFIRFLASTDAHIKNGHAMIEKSTEELSQAQGELLKLIGVDFAADLGDTVWGDPESDPETVLAEAKAFNTRLHGALRGETLVRAAGNHETDVLTSGQLQSFVYSHNKRLQRDPLHPSEGYGLLDLEGPRVRVILLNTNQVTESGGSGMSDAQLQWLAETALRMDGRSDWSVITLGHHPIGYNNPSLVGACARVIEAFVNRSLLNFTTNGGTRISADYRESDCHYVGHFHGHAHAFSAVNMQKFQNGAYTALPVWEICIPNACFERNNQYLGNGVYTERYSTETTYAKSDEDGKRTSFNLVTVCLDKRRIYADNFGAGIDRVIDY